MKQNCMFRATLINLKDKIFIKSTRQTDTNWPESQIIFLEKSPTQDLVKRTLSLPPISHQSWVF